ncbi:MAG TPA: DUF885 family protein [Caulobacteraceae bacterium]|nr:DUF885 family protein [Caulobacteraceae bacterium]
MLDRRHLIAVTAAAAATTPALARTRGAVVDAAASRAEGARMLKLFNDFVQEFLDRSPESATGVGFDVGPRAHQRSELDDRSLAKAARWKIDDEKDLADLHAINRAILSPADKISYDVVDFVFSGDVEGEKSFDYATGQLQRPYVVSQLSGAYQRVPDFLDSQHPVKTKADADAYLARLAAFRTALDQESDQVRHDASLGCTPPDFVLDKTLIQLRALGDAPADRSNLVSSLARRTKAAGIAGDWDAAASKIYEGDVRPAVQRQIAVLQELRAHAVHDAGVWRLPEGGEYYRQSLAQATTTSLSPAEVHKLGLEKVAELSGELNTLLHAQGYSKGTVGERLRALYDDPRFRYPNTDEGKEKLIVDLNAKIAAITRRLPDWFGVLPRAPLLIKRVPKTTEAGAPGGYYQGASLDGARPGMYYINLRDTAEVPSWTLPTLTFHEGVPGHHLQISIAQEAPLPIIRRVLGFNAYQEGWALYAEQLAGEMGMYDDDPMGRIGYLHDALFRGVRLVVDTGLNQLRWSREKTVKYYTDTIGDQEASAITEVERYCVQPGQACSYMVGKLTWLRLRAKARAALGARFDIRKFHDAALLGGAMPLAVLETVIDQYIAAAKTA